MKKYDSPDNKIEITKFIERLVTFNSGLKLYHWHVMGRASYAQHIAIDQALSELRDYTDSIAEISYAMVDDINIVVPETCCPTSIIDYVDKQISFIDESRKIFSEIFIQSMLDDFQKTLEQLMFRLKRLS